MEVDHFDPRKKREIIQSYDNLFPAKRACNNRKNDQWPKAVEIAAGIYLINCCVERDYGKHIFEDPISHRVWGATPAGIYHIRVLGLNTDNLIAERKDRSDQRELLIKKIATVKPGVIQDPAQRAVLCGLIKLAKANLAKLIPVIELRPEPKAHFKSV